MAWVGCSHSRVLIGTCAPLVCPTTAATGRHTTSWNSTDRVAAFFECPDIFPIGNKYMAMASLYNWGAGGYFTNEWFLGTITDNKFAVEDRGLLDYGIRPQKNPDRARASAFSHSHHPHCPNARFALRAVVDARWRFARFPLVPGR